MTVVKERAPFEAKRDRVAAVILRHLGLPEETKFVPVELVDEIIQAAA